MALNDVKRNWEKWAETDPYYGILSDPNKRGGKWDAKEFFETGVNTVENILNKVDSSGLLLQHRRALDFGCGVGRLTRPLGTRFDEVIGVDISSRMVELANGLSPPPNCEFIVNDKSDLSLFPDGHFDFVLSLITLQHMNPGVAKSYLREFLRVLSSGGMACFGMPEALKESSGLKGHMGTLIFNHPRVTSLYLFLRHPKGPRTEMHGIKRADVVSLVESTGCSVKAIEETQDAGKQWSSYRYLVSKA